MEESMTRFIALRSTTPSAKEVLRNAKIHTYIHLLDLLDLKPLPFSHSATLRLNDNTSDYLTRLVSESTKLSKHRHEETVSSAVVEYAAQNLIFNPSRPFFRHSGTIGGILLGAGLPSFLAIATGGQSSVFGITLSACFAIIGTFMIGVHIAKE